ncbi:MOSC domain-containing protein [Streptomyces sp. NPDC056647]|uniref:MOSC domain-containing protein n=1 Tax=unclassified Streptomyces TaxID=2593676 RepID=UPI0036C4799C
MCGTCDQHDGGGARAAARDPRSNSGPAPARTALREAPGHQSVCGATPSRYSWPHSLAPGQEPTRAQGPSHSAAYASTREDLDEWDVRLGGPLRSGVFGENLTGLGLDVNGALIGGRRRIGERVVPQKRWWTVHQTRTRLRSIRGAVEGRPTRGVAAPVPAGCATGRRRRNETSAGVHPPDLVRGRPDLAR